jgi:hypothetical protein
MLYALLRRTHTVLGAVLFHTLIVRDRFLDRMVPWPTGNAGEKETDS